MVLEGLHVGFYCCRKAFEGFSAICGFRVLFHFAYEYCQASALQYSAPSRIPCARQETLNPQTQNPKPQTRAIRFRAQLHTTGRRICRIEVLEDCLPPRKHTMRKRQGPK